jgi:hypothetical protein
MCRKTPGIASQFIPSDDAGKPVGLVWKRGLSDRLCTVMERALQRLHPAATFL